MGGGTFWHDNETTSLPPDWTGELLDGAISDRALAASRVQSFFPFRLDIHHDRIQQLENSLAGAEADYQSFTSSNWTTASFFLPTNYLLKG